MSHQARYLPHISIPSHSPPKSPIDLNQSISNQSVNGGCLEDNQLLIPLDHTSITYYQSGEGHFFFLTDAFHNAWIRIPTMIDLMVYSDWFLPPKKRINPGIQTDLRTLTPRTISHSDLPSGLNFLKLMLCVWSNQSRLTVSIIIMEQTHYMDRQMIL